MSDTQVSQVFGRISRMVRVGASVLLMGVFVLIVGGCGGSGGKTLEISGDGSFAGMRNPGSLAEAIDRFGYPDEIYGRRGDIVDCYASWNRYGIKGLFQNWGASPGGQVCAPRRDFALTSVDLRGKWSTDEGLAIGDPVKRMISVYGIRKGERCFDEVGRGGVLAWTIRSIGDPLGGPGARLCTLGAIVAKGKVAGFVMSNQGASE